MGVDWALYEKLLGNGETTDKRELIISEAVNSFTSGMVDDPAYQENAKINGVTTPLIASRSSVIECAIKAEPNTDIHIGDIVECYDEYWIVYELYIDKVGIINGIMWLCNDIIRFQNRSETINERYCVIDDGTYSKISTDPEVKVMENTYKIYMSIDEDTRKLFVDKRLGLGEVYTSTGEKILEVYKIIGIDLKSRNFGKGSHLMVLTVQRDVFDAASDDISNNICNVYLSSEDVSTPNDAGNCSITGKDTIRLGVTRKYTAVFTDNLGAADNEAVAKWLIDAPNGVTYKQSGNTCSVTVPLDENIVGSYIFITLSDENSSYGTFEKKVQVIAIG